MSFEEKHKKLLKLFNNDGFNRPNLLYTQVDDQIRVNLKEHAESLIKLSDAATTRMNHAESNEYKLFVNLLYKLTFP
jgi:hypothetical protein